ncbi:Retrovirus-related Pol polyprotein from transposon TNT 1-94 [Vitis vinifera]|uniref:Retrovirus-related Pol polyprotein from transposon TNT 1-94 n=1 Tax=Vitis vinifera TaxID=29760 RepID=A0A438HPA9_VITVI|nr:Retrovirus-related Pol polyprotein from transposon TNT 1-94 [Vitis vinifera]
MEEKAEAGLVWVGCGSSSEPSSGSEPRFEESIDPNPKATLLNSETRFQEMKAKSGAIAQLLDVSMFSLCLIGWVRIGDDFQINELHRTCGKEEMVTLPWINGAASESADSREYQLRGRKKRKKTKQKRRGRSRRGSGEICEFPCSFSLERSYPSLDSKGCGVVFVVDSLGEDNSPLRLVSENDSSLEFEKVEVIPIEFAAGEKDKEDGSYLGLVSMKKDLLAYDVGSKFLMKVVDTSFPKPLLLLEAETNFCVNNIVDEFYRDEWWTSVITRISEDLKCIIFFQNPPDEIQFDWSNLQMHEEWVDDKWIKPKKQRMAGYMDIDYGIRKDEPPKITDTSTPDQILLYKRWDKSNRLNVMYIKTKISVDKALASTLIMKFTSLKLTGIKGVCEHIMEMRDIVAQLNKLEVEMSESGPFLVYFILNILPLQYGPFKIFYNTHKNKWSINELMTMCVQEEERLIMEQGESVMLGMQNLRKSVSSEQFIFSGNKMGSHVEAIGTYNDATLRRSTQTKRSAIPSDYIVYLQESDYNIGAKNDPGFFSQAMSCKELKLWYNAMKEEMSSMRCNDVWDLVELPNGAKAIGSHFDMELEQMDVKTAFLNEELEEEVYMKQLKEFPSSDDDILLAINDKGLLHEVKQFLSKNFDMKDMGEASYVIGIKIHKDGFQGILGMSQETYINKVLERFWIKDCSPSVFPIVKGDSFNLNECPKNDLEREQMKNISYASAVGSLMYA